ncbi:MAG: CDP-diacylglycerol--glycerol-3-phosphate 3-phosphatidyltransferase [Deltaproteobacteria bacterium]|nr:CDP-diacylglycerol--glycerol-3-phosphate 3-phosphatidyltransferase [Deltaproteobacteria bacterium]
MEELKKTPDHLPAADKRESVLNFPNKVTLLRISVIPVLFFLLMDPGQTGSLIITLLFILASLTDLLDGYLARKYQSVTAMGQFLDPIADKLIVNTAMIVMIPIGRIPAWIVAIIVIRDFIVDGIRAISSSRGIIMQASKLGKQKTLCQIFAVSALMIHYPFLGVNAHAVGVVILSVALVLSVYSGVDYFITFYRSVIKE